METLTCKECHKEVSVGEWPWCPHGRGTNNVIQDSIEGGIEIKHGICWPDGSPRKYYSKAEMKKVAKEKGLVNYVTHVPDPKSGSDKSKFTQRFI